MDHNINMEAEKARLDVIDDLAYVNDFRKIF